MTRDDIIRMAQEACDTDKSEPWDGGFWIFRQESIERFAALLEKSVYENEDMFAEAYAGGYAAGAAAEREECAKMCETHASANTSWTKAAVKDCAAAIRARGEI